MPLIGDIQVSKKNKKQKKQYTYEEPYPEQDEYFYYIAGYTSGGAPYGITWEEARRDGLVELEDYDEE